MSTNIHRLDEICGGSAWAGGRRHSGPGCPRRIRKLRRYEGGEGEGAGEHDELPVGEQFE